MDVKDLVELTVNLLRNVRSEADSVQMARYMKNRYVYFGVKAPSRKEIQRELKVHWKKLDDSSLFQYAEELWKLPQRELQYVAIDVLQGRSKKWDEKFLPKVEQLIISKSWWDTVDALAQNVAGAIFMRFPESRISWVEKWNTSDNMWLNRSALLHQLKYKDNTNLDLLFALIESHIDSKEFFINKASGWALRQASKIFPTEVQIFITNHPNLSNLTKREGSKYLN